MDTGEHRLNLKEPPVLCLNMYLQGCTSSSAEVVETAHCHNGSFTMGPIERCFQSQYSLSRSAVCFVAVTAWLKSFCTCIETKSKRKYIMMPFTCWIVLYSLTVCKGPVKRHHSSHTHTHTYPTHTHTLPPPSPLDVWGNRRSHHVPLRPEMVAAGGWVTALLWTHCRQNH